MRVENVCQHNKTHMTLALAGYLLFSCERRQSVALAVKIVMDNQEVWQLSNFLGFPLNFSLPWPITLSGSPLPAQPVTTITTALSVRLADGSRQESKG